MLAAVQASLERCILERPVGLAEIVSGQQIPCVARESIVAHQGAAEPDTQVVLDGIIGSASEAEAVRRDAVLVVHHLRAVSLPAHLRGGLDLKAAVLAGADKLRLAVLDPDLDVLPVVAVAGIQEVGNGDVLLEVVSVDVRAPAVVAALTRVHVVVAQVGLVTAVLGQARPVVVETLDNVAVGVDGGDVVAAVGVEVEHGLPAEVVGGGALGQGLRRVDGHDVSGRVVPGAIGKRLEFGIRPGQLGVDVGLLGGHGARDGGEEAGDQAAKSKVGRHFDGEGEWQEGQKDVRPNGLVRSDQKPSRLEPQLRSSWSRSLHLIHRLWPWSKLHRKRTATHVQASYPRLVGPGPRCLSMSGRFGGNYGAATAAM